MSADVHSTGSCHEIICVEISLLSAQSDLLASPGSLPLY